MIILTVILSVSEESLLYRCLTSFSMTVNG